ncbi:tyrosine-type recombinase/integrase [Allosaccharopolyspora coralli]|uniref:tyrosine-type recombinase/integrase n=1 Tax=Allosaccharopolyspora coralli TaxID=2665642 RepID=UPI001651E735|nr:site-specific integrase [Allosaccharopolyspora coralli]
MERVGSSKTKARDTLRAALRDRERAVVGDEVTRNTRMAAVATLWLRELDESSKAYRTKRTYQEAWERDLSAAVADLRVFEVTVSVATRVLRSIRDTAGTGSAKHAKVVLSGVLGLAVRHDALDSNPMREVVIGTPARDTGKGPGDKMVLTSEELVGLRRHLRTSCDASRYERQDLPDLVDMLSALGCRIGELLALDWSKFDAGRATLAIEGTVIREKGVGLKVQSHTKSSAGMRTVQIPKWAAKTLVRRSHEATTEWVFPAANGRLRDPDNTRKMLRKAVAATSWMGLHPHAFRHLVATRLDEAGLSAREIADYLGHEQVSMTQDVYMNRKSVGSSAADALADIEPEG